MEGNRFIEPKIFAQNIIQGMHMERDIVKFVCAWLIIFRLWDAPLKLL